MPDENEPLANELIRSVELLADTFNAAAVSYALVDGLATSLRGRPRFTQDVDILLDVPQIKLPGILERLADQGFTLDTATVIREYVDDGITAFRFGTVRIDWRKPVLSLHSRTLASATTLGWTRGYSLRVATPEALILTKMIAFRPRDQEDIESLLIANRDELELDLIRREWTAVAGNENSRSVWLERAIARLAYKGG